MSQRREPFAEFAKFERGIPLLRYHQNRTTAHVSWGDGLNASVARLAEAGRADSGSASGCGYGGWPSADSGADNASQTHLAPACSGDLGPSVPMRAGRGPKTRLARLSQPPSQKCNVF
jgi:hypothetical protein